MTKTSDSSEAIDKIGGRHTLQGAWDCRCFFGRGSPFAGLLKWKPPEGGFHISPLGESSPEGLQGASKIPVACEAFTRLERFDMSLGAYPRARLKAHLPCVSLPSVHLPFEAGKLMRPNMKQPVFLLTFLARFSYNARFVASKKNRQAKEGEEPHIA